MFVAFVAKLKYEPDGQKAAAVVVDVCGDVEASTHVGVDVGTVNALRTGKGAVIELGADVEVVPVVIVNAAKPVPVYAVLLVPIELQPISVAITIRSNESELRMEVEVAVPEEGAKTIPAYLAVLKVVPVEEPTSCWTICDVDCG